MRRPTQHNASLLLSRDRWLQYHRYLALMAGLFFALLGVSGSLSVYRNALDEMLNPQLVIEQPGNAYLPLDRIMDAVRKVHPGRDGSWRLEMPNSPHGMMTAWYEKPHETIGEYYAPLMVSVNPYNAEVVASRFWGKTATTWLLDLHTRLRYDHGGENLVGMLGVLLMISVGSGLYLWWPGVRQVLAAFSIRHDAGMVRLAFDLHRVIGLCSAAALLLIAFTGMHLSYPKILETLTGTTEMHHGSDNSAIRSSAALNNIPVGLGSAAFIARSVFPRAELRQITTPEGTADVYRVSFHQQGEHNRTYPYSSVWVDRWSGQIMAIRNPAQFSSGQTFGTWMWPLHSGEIFAASGRFLWFLVGLTPMLLYISGLLCWLQRRGYVQDRPVDFPALWRYLRYSCNQAYGIALKALGAIAGSALHAGRQVRTSKLGKTVLRRISNWQPDSVVQWIHKTCMPKKSK